MRVVDYFRLLLLAAIWGSSFLFMRIAVPAVGAVNTAFLRVVLGALGLAILVWVLRVSLRFAGKFRSALALGVINSGIPFLMYCLAAQWLPAGYSATLNATTPLMGAVIGVAAFGEQLTRRKWAGVMLGFLGIALITTRGEVTLSASLVAGILACLLATSCYGLAGFLTRRWILARGGLDPMLVALGSQLGAALFLLPFFGATQVLAPAVDWWQWQAWVSLLAVGLLCTALAYILYFRLIADIGPLRSLTVTFLIPPFGVLWGYLVLGETISPGYLLGAAVVGVAVWLVVGAKPAAEPAATRPVDIRR